MKIANVRVFLIDEAQNPLNRRFVFARVETEDGIVGWGEAYAIRWREHAIAEIIKNLSNVLIALPHASPRTFVDAVAKSFTTHHLSIDVSSGVSALEMALWDIEGKVAGKPLHQLLGTATTSTVPLYANMWCPSPDETADSLVARCCAVKDQGFKALKIYPMRYGHLPDAVDCARRVREAIGDDMDMMIDVAVLDDPSYAIDVARGLEPFNPYWFEEPVAGENLDAMAEVRRDTSIPIVTGERQCGIHHFRNVLEKQAADILNPEIAGAGSILDMMELAKLADAQSVKISPHCWDSMTLALAAMVHICAVLPNALAGEYFQDYVPFCETLARLDFSVVDGHATLPDTPGLGVHMDEEAFEAFAYN